MKRYDRVRQFLDEAVAGQTIGAHGNFWRGLTLADFLVKRVFGRILVTPGDPDNSNLVRALEGTAPFGSDAGTAGALFKRMPAEMPPMPRQRITYIRDWILAGCPDDFEPLPTPGQHNDYWRDFDDWAMFHASTATQNAIGEVFNRVSFWFEFARDPAKLPSWSAAVADPPMQAALVLLGDQLLNTVLSHYGDPIDLDAVLDSYELFGADKLPDDSLRPVDVRHNMNGEIMWFIFAAFVDAQLRGPAPVSDWFIIGRAVILGLINDGLFRGRFPVNGFTADPAGANAARSFVRALPDTDVAGELARRFVDSGLG